MKLLLRFPRPGHKTPRTAEVILETGAKMNIDKANVDAVRGELIVDVPSDKVNSVAEHFREKGVEVRKLVKLIALDEQRCVHCGACISVCPTGVFKFNPSWQIDVDEEKCIRCEVCVNVCPLRALACVE